jgi:predicted negative regulator of RcsB-dependent stress response
MKSTRKHELQTNELADALWHYYEQIKPHGQLIGYVALGVIVLVLILVVLPTFRSSQGSAAEAAFVEAMGSHQPDPLRNFLKQYPTAEQAATAKLLLADRLLSEAVRATPSPGEDLKAKAAKLIDEAKELYGQVAQSSKAFEPLARTGLAMVTIQEGNLDAGRKALEEVVAKWPQSIGAEKAKANLEALAGYKPEPFSNEPLEEPKPSAAPGETKAPEASKAETKPAEVKPAETKPAETKPAPAPVEKAPATPPKG